MSAGKEGGGRARPPPFVARFGELTTLEQHIERACGGEFHALLLLGDPGVGKTRLAHEAVGRRGRSVTALWARGYPLGTTSGFGLWGEALDGHARGLPPDGVEALCRGHERDLATVMLTLAVSRRRTAEVRKERLVQAFATVLARLSEQSPVVVVLDDMHVADPSSWEALAPLSRMLRAHAVLVILIARPGELADLGVAAQVLADLDQQGVLSRLEVPPLAPADVRQLARAVIGAPGIPEALHTWLIDRSKGNPLFAVGLLHALLDSGGDPERPHVEGVPTDLADRVRAQLVGLDEPALATLEVLALLGRVEMTDLARLSGRPFERLAEILDGLARRRLVAEQEVGRQLVFEVAHPLVQETVYESIGPARRRALHRQVARGLRTMGRLGAAAPHFARSAGAGDDEAIDALVDAVREVEGREAYHEAFVILEALLDLLPAGDRRWVNVLQSMAREPEWVIDHRVDLDAAVGVEVLRRIGHALSATPDARGRADVQFRLAHFLAWGLGELSESRSAITEARALFARAGDQRATLLAANEAAFIAGMGGDLDGWEAGHRATAEAASAAGDRLVLVQALGGLGIPLEWQGRLAESEAAFRESADMAREDGRAYRVNWNLVHLAIGLAWQGRAEEAETALAAARAAYHDSAETISWYASWVWWLVGDRRAAVATVSDLVALHRAVPRRLLPAVVFGAAAAADAALPTEAQLFLDRAEAALAPGPWFGFEAVARWCRGIVARFRDGPGAALPLFEAAARKLRALGYLPKLSLVLVDVAEAAALSGDAEAAERAARLLDRTAAAIDVGPFGALGSLADGWAKLVLGARVEAARTAAVAAEGLAGWPAYRARALALRAEALVQMDRPSAVDAFDEAARLLAAVGGEARRNEVLSQLAGLGPRGRRAAARSLGHHSLTARERQVARLAAEGWTAGEIAARLFVGERTVETHLSRAYAKLGVASKRELARRAAELGL